MLLTVEEAGYILNKNRRHVYGLLSCGHIFAYKVTPRIAESEHTSWRIPEKDLLEYVKRNKNYNINETQKRIKNLRKFLELHGVKWYEG